MHPPGACSAPPPPHHVHPTPAPRAPNPEGTGILTGNEPEGKATQKVAKKLKVTVPVYPDGYPSSHIPILDEWFEYKRQRREAYVPIGWQRLCSEQAKYSSARLKVSVDTSMANNWKGLFTEKIAEPEVEEIWIDPSKLTPDQRMEHYRKSYPESDWPYIMEDGSLDVMAKMMRKRAENEAKRREAEGQDPDSTGGPELW